MKGISTMKHFGLMDVGLAIYIPSNSISVILREWEDDNERLRAMKPHLCWLKRFPPPVEFGPGPLAKYVSA